MTIELQVPDSIAMDPRTLIEFRAFLQALVNRFCVGSLRYGDRPDRRQCYLTGLAKELRAYRSDGNAEQLMNIAVYAFLESAAPENKKLHWNAAAPSVTRSAEPEEPEEPAIPDQQKTAEPGARGRRAVTLSGRSGQGVRQSEIT